jgi:hypothetical protein
MKGNVGNISPYSSISPDERLKIESKKRGIFDAKVEGRIRQLQLNFTNRLYESLDPDRMTELEIDSIKNVLIRDRHQHSHKIAHNEDVSFGSYTYPFYVLNGIQRQYENAITGKLDFNYITSPNQKFGVGASRAIEKCMIDAVALHKFVKLLEGSGTGRTNDNVKAKFTSSEIDDLSNKIESLKSDILNHFDSVNRNMTEVHLRLQTGQEVIFNELDELKTLIPSLKKKNWEEIVKGKLLDLAVRGIIDRRILEWLWKELTNQDFKLLLPSP